MRTLCLLSALALGLSSSGCVSLSRYDEVATERDQLADTKQSLEERLRLQGIANQSLEDEVVRLKDEREDLFEVRTTLERDNAEKGALQASLSERLAVREAELAATSAALLDESRKVAELTTTYDSLVGDLEAEVAKGEIRIEQLRDGLQVDVAQDVLFPSGSGELSKSGAAVLATVAARLAPLPYLISVEGHSDDVPIRATLAKQYPTNWELAGARAASVVRVLVEGGVDGAKASAVSHGPYQPIADNKSPEGRAQNRRIEIRLRPDPEAEPISAEKP